ncbi:hypothetical protein K144316041_p21420 (plasmid) [Clostridium tetani]|uniref:DNA sulfur modification protein DndB n=1 Tax=Clostridium tetani TaxID=1513 RepID=UPI002954CB2C|nr:DNA sulfur modification protein DndB [Clostridium tetani]BDR74303.1 hypothetical protein K144316041_p21420 [Clostridium tetani]
MKNRKELENKISALLKKYNGNENIYKSAKNDLKNKMTFNKFSDIFDGRLPTKFLNNIDLYLITNSLYKNLKKIRLDNKEIIKEINPLDYFTEIEINQGENTFIQEKNIKDYLTIPNVKQVADDIFICSKASLQFIAKAFNDGFTLYNPDTQRGGEKKSVYGEEVVVPTVFDESIDGIAKELKRGTYIPTMITWNILKNGYEDFKYDPIKQEIIFKKNKLSQINIVDGQNRTLGVVKAMADNPNLEGFFYIQIHVFDVSKARKFIVQESKHHPVDLETIELFKPNRFMDITKYLNEYGSEEINMMFNKIEKTEDEVIELKKYTIFEVLSSSIEDCFKDKLETPRDNNKVKKYLVDFFNEFLGINYNYLQNVEKTRQESVILDINMFAGYIYIASKLYGIDNWKDKLEVMCLDINWGKSTEWKDLRYWAELTFSTRERIYQYFDKYI